MGFEPTGRLAAASGFQDRPVRPLRHPAGEGISVTAGTAATGYRRRGRCANVAVTVRATFIVTRQVRFVPLQPPLQRTNVAPAKGVAVSVIFRPAVNRCTHRFARPVPVHRPAGVRTRPRPLTRIVRARVVGALLNVAETV